MAKETGRAKVLLGVMVDPELREKTHLAVRRLPQYGNLTEFIVAKSREVIEQAGLSFDDVRLPAGDRGGCDLDAHRVMVGDVEVNVRAEDYGVCHSHAHYGSNDCWHVRKACAAWGASRQSPPPGASPTGGAG